MICVRALHQATACGLSLLFLLFPGASGCVEVTAPGAPKPEAFRLLSIKQDCALCHASHQKDQGTLLLKKPLAALCLDCHPERMSPTEHKIGIVPSMSTGTLPLADNKLTCITCHDPHSNRYGRMLRVPAKNLCQTCHLQ